MEAKIEQYTEAGSKISYSIRTGHVVHEIVKAFEETDYDLVETCCYTQILRGF